MHPIDTLEETITLWDNKVPSLEDNVIGQLTYRCSKHIDEKGIILVIEYDFKLFHHQTNEILFNVISNCKYDLLRDEELPTLEEIKLIFGKAYKYLKNEFDKRKRNSNLKTITLPPLDPDSDYIEKTYKSILIQLQKRRVAYFNLSSKESSSISITLKSLPLLRRPV